MSMREPLSDIRLKQIEDTINTSWIVCMSEARAMARELREARAELAALREDKALLDWLEGELAREQAAIAAQIHTPEVQEHRRAMILPPSLYRQNVPITRVAIKAARDAAPSSALEGETR